MLEGQFVEDKLKLFENLVHLAYQGKVLSQASYQQFQVWLKDMRVQMVDDVVVKESFERTFYGFAYTKANGRLAYFFNGQKEIVYEKKEKLEAEGLNSTPILKQTRWFDYSVAIKDVRKAYEDYLVDMYDQNYSI